MAAHFCWSNFTTNHRRLLCCNYGPSDVKNYEHKTHANCLIGEQDEKKARPKLISFKVCVHLMSLRAFYEWATRLSSTSKLAQSQSKCPFPMGNRWSRSSQHNWSIWIVWFLWMAFIFASGVLICLQLQLVCGTLNPLKSAGLVSTCCQGFLAPQARCSRPLIHASCIV